MKAKMGIRKGNYSQFYQHNWLKPRTNVRITIDKRMERDWKRSALGKKRHVALIFCTK